MPRRDARADRVRVAERRPRDRHRRGRARLGVGLSSFVSIGNKADLSGNDFLQYWEHDPDTERGAALPGVVRQPAPVRRVARRVGPPSRSSPSRAAARPPGARATASHTGALLAASDVTVDALFEQAGVIRTDTLAELFDVAALLASPAAAARRPGGDRHQRRRPGHRLRRRLRGRGRRRSPSPRRRCARRLAARPAGGGVGANPVDMIATASAEDYSRHARSGRRFRRVRRDHRDLRPAARHRRPRRGAGHPRASAEHERCVLAAVFMAAEGPPAELSDDGLSVPGYQFPEEAARALGHAARYGAWRARPAGAALTADPEAVAAGRRDRRGLAARRGLDDAGGGRRAARPPRHRPGPGARRAQRQRRRGRRRELGWPVALKAVAPGLVHKRDAGAVATSLRTPAELRRAAEAMRASVTAAGYEAHGFMVQPMIPDGVELIVGMVEDASFGPVVACGAGGTNTELLKDVAVRITPVTDRDAAEMLRALKLYPLLTGYRGSAPCDIAAVETLLLRVSAHGRRPPRDRRAGLQPGDRPPRRGHRRRRPRAAPRTRAPARCPRWTLSARWSGAGSAPPRCARRASRARRRLGLQNHPGGDPPGLDVRDRLVDVVQRTCL